ncbi:unnamed protein product, partial [marine sediment metagenome]
VLMLATDVLCTIEWGAQMSIPHKCPICNGEQKMYDLIYTENHQDYREIEEIIKKSYPQAKVEDGSDYIHEHRFSVEFYIEEKDWFTFIVRNGFALHSLIFQIVLQSEPDRIEELLGELRLLKI